MKNNIYLLVIIFLLFIILLLGYYLFTNETSQPKEKYVTKIDTSYLAIFKDPIKYEKIKAETIYEINDSTNKIIYFKAEADTVLNFDTVKITYSYPENYFEIKISGKADSIMVQNMYSESIEYLNPNWWENPLYFIFGFLIGIISTII